MNMSRRQREFWKAALIRAGKTVAQTLASTIPAGYVITPTMIKEFNCGYVVIGLAWLATGLLAGVTSILTSVAAGLPEVDDTKIYMRRER